jgi:hypothetical protein
MEQEFAPAYTSVEKSILETLSDRRLHTTADLVRALTESERIRMKRNKLSLAWPPVTSSRSSVITGQLIPPSAISLSDVSR